MGRWVREILCTGMTSYRTSPTGGAAAQTWQAQHLISQVEAFVLFAQQSGCLTPADPAVCATLHWFLSSSYSPFVLFFPSPSVPIFKNPLLFFGPGEETAAPERSRGADLIGTPFVPAFTRVWISPQSKIQHRGRMGETRSDDFRSSLMTLTHSCCGPVSKDLGRSSWFSPLAVSTRV